MKLKLKEIVSVQMGYSFRVKLESSKDGNIAIIQMKDLLKNNTVNCDELLKISTDSMKAHHFVKKGDLIFRSRGLITNSAILIENLEDTVVAAPLLRIRITKDNIMPEYLNWFISQPESQSYLTSRAKGTAQKMISKKAIENMEIFLPDLEKQRLIVELANLSAKESYILKVLGEKKEKYFGGLLMQSAKLKSE